MNRQPRVLYVVTSSLSLWLLRGQARYLRERGFEVRVICAPGPEVDGFARDEGVAVATVPLQREMAPWSDLVAIARLWREIRRFRPDILNVGTPKAGLLGGIAGRLADVPQRIYLLRGLRVETARGTRRLLLYTAERLAVACAHRVVCVSASLRERAIALGIVIAPDVVVLGKGSSNGVLVADFAPTTQRITAAEDLRVELGIPANAPVIGFVGRFTRDKGLLELLEAYARLRERFSALRLLLVGGFEQGDRLPPAAEAQLRSDPQIVMASAGAPTFSSPDATQPGVRDIAPFYHAMDVVTLPTHREGFPNVALEAAAASKPVVGARATGMFDAVVPDETGLLVPVGDSAALASALARLLDDRALAQRLGDAAHARVLQHFQREQVCSAWLREYQRLLEPRARGLYVRAGKRAFDLVAAAMGLIVLSPILLMIGLLVRMRLGAPLFFRQQRPGRHAEIFELIKFRTMNDARDAAGQLLPDSERLTPLGKLLRASSLDELPELWNVLKGEMSLVGPRPLLIQYLDRYTPRQRRRHEVRPGITGWAQVRGRNALSWEQKFELDLWYVEHASFLVDVRILLETIAQVLRRQGVSQPGHATMPEFMGTGSESAKTS